MKPIQMLPMSTIVLLFVACEPTAPPRDESAPLSFHVVQAPDACKDCDRVTLRGTHGDSRTLSYLPDPILTIPSSEIASIEVLRAEDDPSKVPGWWTLMLEPSREARYSLEDAALYVGDPTTEFVVSTPRGILGTVRAGALGGKLLLGIFESRDEAGRVALKAADDDQGDGEPLDCDTCVGGQCAQLNCFFCSIHPESMVCEPEIEDWFDPGGGGGGGETPRNPLECCTEYRVARLLCKICDVKTHVPEACGRDPGIITGPLKGATIFSPYLGGAENPDAPRRPECSDARRATCQAAQHEVDLCLDAD